MTLGAVASTNQAYQEWWVRGVLIVFDNAGFSMEPPRMGTLGVSQVPEFDRKKMIAQQTHTTFWQIFCGENIKPDVQGELLYLLEIPGTTGVPVLRNAFDPAGVQYPANSYDRLQALLELGHHGIMFDGVSKAAVEALMDWEPPMTREDDQFMVYNRRLVWSSMNLLLCDPVDALEQIPDSIVRLLKLTATPITVGKC